MKTLRVRNWDANFENASSRKLKRLDWVAIPNRMDGPGYTALVDHPNGAAHLGAWLAIVEIASRQGKKAEDRGVIPDGVGGICQCLGRISRLPGGIFEEVIPRLIEIGWIEEVQSNQQSAEIVAESADALGESAIEAAESADEVAAQGMEGNGRERKGSVGKPRAPIVTLPSIDFEARYLALYGKHIILGFQVEGQYEYSKIISSAMNPEVTANAIDKAHAEWMQFFAANPEAYRPGIGKWLKEGYWARLPEARASPRRKESFADVVNRQIEERLARGEKPW